MSLAERAGVRGLYEDATGAGTLGTPPPPPPTRTCQRLQLASRGRWALPRALAPPPAVPRSTSSPGPRIRVGTWGDVVRPQLSCDPPPSGVTNKLPRGRGEHPVRLPCRDLVGEGAACTWAPRPHLFSWVVPGSQVTGNVFAPKGALKVRLTSPSPKGHPSSHFWVLDEGQPSGSCGDMQLKSEQAGDRGCVYWDKTHSTSASCSPRLPYPRRRLDAPCLGLVASWSLLPFRLLPGLHSHVAVTPGCSARSSLSRQPPGYRRPGSGAARSRNPSW